MATGAFSKAIVPKSFTVSVGTSPTRLKSSSTLAVKFTVVGLASNKLSIGDSSVSITRGIPIAAGSSKDFQETKPVSDMTYSYDLSHVWAVCTAASQTVTVMTFPFYKDL
jgi:hypothetical protein